MKVNNKVIVVTGGGSGIGRQLVLQLLNKGARVAAADINEASLKETAELAGDKQDRLSLHVLDVTNRKAVEALPSEVIKKHGAVDGLINNAGIIQPFVRLNDLDYAAIDRVLNINLYGPIYMTKSFLPHLLERPEGHIVNLSSMGGFFPVPGQSLYGASKAGVKLLTEGLYAELYETHVDVTVVFPGAVETNITTNSGIEVPSTEGDSQSFPTTSSQDAAATIIDGMEKAKFHVFVGSDAKMMDTLYRISPKRATKFMYNQMKSLLPK